MSTNSNIEWTKHTGNLWWGCVEVSPACDHCYARQWAKRYDRAKWGANEPRLTIAGVWNDFKRWQRAAAAADRTDRVFVGSMMDIFEKPMPVIDSKGELVGGITTGTLRDGFCEEVVPASPNLLFLLLTKRAGNIASMVPAAWLTAPPANVMYGTSVGTRDEYLREVPKLIAVPGKHFLSIEPLLEDMGEVDLTGIDWVIVGGESGAGARPMHPLWPERIRRQCAKAGVPFFFKQWGAWLPAVKANCKTFDYGGEPTDEQLENDNPRFHHWPDGWISLHVSKKAAGRYLFDEVYDEFPGLVPRTAVPA